MDIELLVQPAAGVRPPASPASISVEAVYARNTADVASASRLAAGAAESSDPFPEAVRLTLDANLSGTTRLENAATLQVQVNVLAADGSTVASHVVKAAESSASRGKFEATFTLSQADLDAVAAPSQAVPPDKVPPLSTRYVRLVPTSDVTIDYARSLILVSPVANAASLAGLAGIGGLVGDKINSVEATGQELQSLTTIAWSPSHLAVDGSFTCSFPQQETAGWLWWLTGDRQVLGFVPDDLSKATDRRLAIALPVLSPPGGSDGTRPKPEPDGKCPDCGSTVPANVTEAEVANNPQIYSEDPGTACKPFANPERVLSERSFSVIARVTQPEISALGSTRTKSVKLLDVEADQAVAPASPGLLDRLRGVVTAARPFNLAAAALPIRYELSPAYVGFVKGLPSGRVLMGAKHPLQWEDDIAQYQSATVSLGHILEYRVRWRSNGYSLGTVASTLTLAPRQARRIQKIEWERRERARRTERTVLSDVENDSVNRERDYDDYVSASLSEWARGGSHSDTSAVAAGIGFFASGILGGIGGGAGSSNSSSHQEGGRDTNASEHQRLRDSIRRHGDALRKFESTVVTEVAQEETVTGTTEVVRNLNYAHSLTVIYYQILRHLKVNTEFAGARECLFVPFAIKAFDYQRAYRWREAIQSAIRSPRYLRALRYLKDVLTNFSTSDIPPGTRANQPLTYLRGSIFVDLAIERPKDTAQGLFEDANWSLFRHLFDTPAQGIFAALAQRVEADRDRYFQANFAPAVAAKWANGLQLRVAGRTFNIDSTLATRYQFNRSARIDFVVPPESLGGLSRSDLQNIILQPLSNLPPGSVGNLTRMTFTYTTARFERVVQGRTGVNDLIRPETGIRDPATVQFPLDSWEAVDERLEIRRSVLDLIEHLNEHVEYYHKAIWWRMDRDRLMMMLDGFYVPNTNNVSIASVVDREPIGIIGNCLIYRVGAASYIGYGTIKTPADLYNLYAQKQPVRDPVLVSLPTDGLYAQTIMDDCLALEEHYGNLDWALSDKDPDLGVIDPSLLGSRRSDPTTGTTPTPFPATIINLQNAPDAPAPSGLQGVLNAVTNPNAFRDMAGLAATQANALAALNTAAGLATSFGNQAAALELAKTAKSQEATKSADQKLATIQRAKDKGLTTDAEAAQQTKEVLASMNPDTPRGEAPHENTAINSAIDAAKSVPGSLIEANTGEGAVKVSIGDVKEDSTGGPLIIDVTITPALRAFGPGVNFTGKTKLSVKGKNLPAGTQLHWNIPASEAGKYTITQSVGANGLSEVEISGIEPGKSRIGIAAISSGVVIQSQIHELSIPQFVTVDDDNALFAAFLAANNLQAISGAILTEAKSVIDRLLLSEANVRLLWKSTGATVPAHIPARFVTTVTIGDTDPSGSYASTKPGPTVPGAIGDTVFDEIVLLFPGNYLAAGAGSDANQAVNDLARVIAGIQASDPDLELWLIRFFGRLLGETMSHELYHTLLPVPFNHNVVGGNEVDTSDIMDGGSFRTFLERTGISAASAAPADFIANLTDNGIGVINKLTGASLTHIHGHFPVPPVPPFDK
jgi:hypothetical protein